MWLHGRYETNTELRLDWDRYRADFRGAYLIMEAESDAEVHAALESLPMHRYMKLEIVPCRSMGIGGT